MTSTKTKKQSKGPALGCAVVVAAAAAVLAFVFVPLYAKFQCDNVRSEAQRNLEVLFVAEQARKAAGNPYTADFGVLGFKATGVIGRPPRYDYVITHADSESFLAEARGKGDLAGDTWTINASNGRALNTQEQCWEPW